MQGLRQTVCTRSKPCYGSSEHATLLQLPNIRALRRRLNAVPVCAGLFSMRPRQRGAPLLPAPPAFAAWLSGLETGHVRRGPAYGVAAAAPATVAAAPATQAAAATPAAAASVGPPLEERTLLHQRIAVRRTRYAAPQVILPQASQLVGLIFSVLGPPTFSPPVPGVRHPNSEGKYELLRLLWRRAERQQQQLLLAAAATAAAAQPASTPEAAEAAKTAAAAAAAAAAEDDAREAALCAALTVHLRVSLGRVFEDARVPTAAREVAAARLREREANVKGGVAAWFRAALARPDLETVLLPLLRAVVGALEARGGFVPDAAQQDNGGGGGRGGPASAASGERHEAAALAAVRAQLPPKWQLLANAHVVALDGRHPGHRAACKWEADFFVLDEDGRAVALFEAKCANANPLMTLLTDAERCIALVDELSGASTVTLRVRDDGSAVVVGGDSGHFGSSSSGGGGSGSGSDDDEHGGALLLDGEGAMATAATKPATPAGGDDDNGDDDGDDDARAAVALRRKQRKAAAAAAKAADKKRWRDVTVPLAPGLRAAYVLGRPLRRKDLRRGLASAATAEALKLAAAHPEVLAAALAADGVAAGDGALGNLASATSSGLSAGPGPGSDDGDNLLSPSSDAESVSSEAASSVAAASDAAGDEPLRLAVRLPPEWRAQIAAKVLARLDLVTDRCTVLALDDGSGGGGGGGGGRGGVEVGGSPS